MTPSPTAGLPDIRISQLPRHGCATISRVDAEGADAARLKSMGLCTGRRVELIQVGDPLILRVLGTRIGLSARLAEQIAVTACEHSHCGEGA